jgi:TfoX/Sxy family transcriptional regulator of competence genes
MSYDEKTAERIRKVLAERDDVGERKMFGGLCFMVNDRMCVGLTSEALMVRVGPDAHEDALAQPHARPMDFTGRVMRGFVFVDPPGFRTPASLARWVKRGVDFALVAPAPRPKKKRRGFLKVPKKRRRLA